MASLVLAQFEDLIKEHVVIALFLTMLIGTHFTCFASTRVQILTQKALAGAGGNAGGQSVAKSIHEIASVQVHLHFHFTCFTSTKVRKLTPVGESSASQARAAEARPGTQFTTQFTGFTSAKVPILTHKALAGSYD
jgi:hypothetical protein